jgi:hypothetical protein
MIHYFNISKEAKPIKDFKPGHPFIFAGNIVINIALIRALAVHTNVLSLTTHQLISANIHEPVHACDVLFTQEDV